MWQLNREAIFSKNLQTKRESPCDSDVLIFSIGWEIIKSLTRSSNPKDTKMKQTNKKEENYLSATLAYKPEWQILTKRCGWFQYHGTDKMELPYFL